ncbi:hypothetical protein DOTSEDRAFT_52711 [Dothistroma septosporum NZE10]|uniref:Uncharacterized protein n=1 Tax=Dothistroma septosporum (strain NZE10 / CBS 128990) TaxID=675120 RepID=N1PPW8_DOTSN|nr:hypothetical protein DOTSEDRAFT_52711 [Dothistroma septosporum NZE10]
MYRKPNGDLGFNIWTFANNAVPSMMKDSSLDPGHISLPQKDLVFLHQTIRPPGDAHSPYAFDDQTFYASQIIWHKTVSKDVYKKLKKTGVLDSEGVVHTQNIGGNLTHDLAKIPAYRQKQLIDLLFWWEEECQRFRKLFEERAELERLVREGGGEGYGEMLERVVRKIKTRPSERDERVERDEDELMVRFVAGRQAEGREERGDEAPPAYS